MIKEDVKPEKIGAGAVENATMLIETVLGDFSFDSSKRLTILPHIRSEFLLQDENGKYTVYLWTDSSYTGIFVSFQKRPGAYPVSVDYKGRFIVRKEITDQLPYKKYQLIYLEEKDGLQPVLFYKAYIDD